MPRLPALPAVDVVRALGRAGFRFERQTGSHLIMRSEVRRVTISVPNHNPVKRGTLRSPLRSAGLRVSSRTRLRAVSEPTWRL
jgi:predicted RNA binding protein YcfA (HicA-like mRNA interferase family)